VVQRVRIRFAKRGRLRFLSHRDVARTFERALRRAAVPMAYSAGFNPHPRVSWVGAAATGAASEAEYVELALARASHPAALGGALDAALPDGLDVLECVVAGPGSLPDRVDGSVWRIRLPGLAPPEVSAAVSAVLERETLEVDRLTKDGRRRIDVRSAIVRMSVSADDSGTSGASHAVGRAENDSCAILELVVRHTTPAVRPDDVLTALAVVADVAPPVPPEPTRLEQGRLREDGSLADPLAPDRDGAGLPGSHVEVS
jgi:radical SAM-linked protein